MADRIENLKALAAEFNIHSPSKLRQQDILEGVNVTLRGAQEALRTDMAWQVFAPKPRSLGKSAASGPDDRLQIDLIDFARTHRARTRIDTRSWRSTSTPGNWRQRP